MCYRCGSDACAHCFNYHDPDKPAHSKQQLRYVMCDQCFKDYGVQYIESCSLYQDANREIEEANMSTNDILGRSREMITPLPKGQPLVNYEPELGHTFIKKDFEDHATCNDCGSRVQFKDNPTAPAEMMAHKCENTGPDYPDYGGGEL